MATTADTTPRTWQIDPAHSNVEFAVKHLMISTVKGRFGAVEGTVVIDDANPERSSADVTIDTTSIDTRQEPRDQHLRSADFFDVETYPTMRFVSTKVKGKGEGEYEVTGNLTIRDVTREVTLDVNEEGRQRDPWGKDRIGFNASTKINRSDFGLKWNQALEAGGVMVGDSIKINIEAEVTSE